MIAIVCKPLLSEGWFQFHGSRCYVLFVHPNLDISYMDPIYRSTIIRLWNGKKSQKADFFQESCLKVSRVHNRWLLIILWVGFFVIQDGVRRPSWSCGLLDFDQCNTETRVRPLTPLILGRWIRLFQVLKLWFGVKSKMAAKITSKAQVHIGLL